MDKFHMKVARYIEDRIDIKKLMGLECSISVTKQVPMLSNMFSSGGLFASETPYTEVLINFGIGADKIFDDAMLQCADCFVMNDYNKAKSAKRFAFSAMNFSYCINGIWYSMIQRNIIVQFAAPLVETTGSGITMLVAGRSYKMRFYR